MASLPKLSFADLHLLHWVTGDDFIVAVFAGQTPPSLPSRTTGTARQGKYRLLLATPTKECVSTRGNKARTHQAQWHAVTGLPAYQWMASFPCFDAAIKACVTRTDGPLPDLTRLRFIHVVARALAVYEIERDKSSQYPQFDKRAIARAMKHIEKLHQFLIEHRHLGIEGRDINTLASLKLGLATYVTDRGKRHDATYPHRMFVRALALGFLHYFGDPMESLVLQLAGLIAYHSDEAVIRAQIKKMKANSIKAFG